MLAQAISGTTRTGYKSAVNSIEKFCTKHNYKLTFPISADTICIWRANNVGGLTFGARRVYLHGIGTTHVELGLPSPILNSPMVWRMYKGIKRMQGAHVTRKRLPITTEVLDQLEAHQDKQTLSGLSLRAAMWLGTTGLLRSGEFAVRNKDSNVLLRSDLQFIDDHGQQHDGHKAQPHTAYMRLTLRQSKTDPFRQGVDVIVSDHRAVAAMLTYIQAHSTQRASDPLFIAEGGKALDVSTLVAGTQALLVKANIADAAAYLGHSFRRGGATSLHLAGASDSIIRVMGRWRSFAFATYVDTPIAMLVKAGRMLAQTQGKKIVNFVRDDFKWSAIDVMAKA